MGEKKSRKETSSMYAVAVIESNQWDPNAISFSTLRKYKNGGKTVYVQTTQAKSKIFEVILAVVQGVGAEFDQAPPPTRFGRF